MRKFMHKTYCAKQMHLCNHMYAYQSSINY